MNIDSKENGQKFGTHITNEPSRVTPPRSFPLSRTTLACPRSPRPSRESQSAYSDTMMIGIDAGTPTRTVLIPLYTALQVERERGEARTVRVFGLCQRISHTFTHKPTLSVQATLVVYACCRGGADGQTRQTRLLCWMLDAVRWTRAVMKSLPCLRLPLSLLPSSRCRDSSAALIHIYFFSPRYQLYYHNPDSPKCGKSEPRRTASS